MSPKTPETLQEVFKAFQTLKSFDSTKMSKFEPVQEILQVAVRKRVVPERQCEFTVIKISGSESESAFRPPEFEFKVKFSVTPVEATTAKRQAESELFPKEFAGNDARAPS